jgi:hypothetical protein
MCVYVHVLDEKPPIKMANIKQAESSSSTKSASAVTAKSNATKKKQRLTLRERKAQRKHPSSRVPLSRNWKQISVRPFALCYLCVATDLLTH